MVWLYRSPIPVGRRGVFDSFKLFLPCRRGLRGRGGGGRHPAMQRHKQLNVQLRVHYFLSDFQDFFV